MWKKTASNEIKDIIIQVVLSYHLLLKENELLHSFLWLKIICYKEKPGKSRHGPACIASLAGINRMK